eukprot:829446-Pyramimonas_sp.AAC.1
MSRSGPPGLRDPQPEAQDCPKPAAPADPSHTSDSPKKNKGSAVWREPVNPRPEVTCCRRQ